MSIFCGLIREECNIFHSQSTVKTLESASQLPYRHMWRRLSYFPRALKVRWTFAQRGPKWNGEWSIAVPAVLCKNHGPFSWGKDAKEAVHNVVVLEEVAKMAYRTELIHPQELQDKHYFRKHGANAYYGQN